MTISNSKEAVLSAILIAAGVLPFSAIAQINFAPTEANLHAHLFSPINKHQINEYKTAKVCFITDKEGCEDDNFDTNDADRCFKEGYTLTSCSGGRKPYNFCIYNNNYFEKCVCPSGYIKCEPPYYGVGEACDGKFASCEKNSEQSCKELNPNYTDSCPSGWQLSPNNRCPYDESFGICCQSCEGYDYTTIPDGYVQDGEACVSCDGITKYKVKINSCDGFLDCGSMGPASGAKTCQSGSQIKYDNCKSCPNLGTYTTCPSPYTCAYEECSNRYYKTGCQSGYDWDYSTQTCTAQCDSSYRYTCTGSYEIPSGSSCNGQYTTCNCQSPYSWNGDQCEINCGYQEIWNGTQCVCDQTYYPYTCTGSNESPVGESCNGMYMECSCPNGYGWFNGSCNLCENKLPDGWTYDADLCPYGVTETETGSIEECYRTRYKCSGCKLSELEVGSPFDFGPRYDSTGAIVEITVINQETCTFNLSVLTNTSTGGCNSATKYFQSFYSTIFANKSKIDAGMQAVSKSPIPTQYPYLSGDTSYPQYDAEGIAGQEVFGTFNMATGLEEDSIVCVDPSGFPFAEPDNRKFSSLTIEEFSCRGETCN